MERGSISFCPVVAKTASKPDRGGGGRPMRGVRGMWWEAWSGSFPGRVMQHDPVARISLITIADYPS
jgi:hypothetical protein